MKSTKNHMRDCALNVNPVKPVPPDGASFLSLYVMITPVLLGATVIFTIPYLAGIYL